MLFTFPSRYLFTIGLSLVFSLAGWCRRIHARFLRSRATQDTATLQIDFVYGTITLYCPTFQLCSTINLYAMSQSYYPVQALTCMVWALSRSLATTWEIIIIFFSSGYLDVSVPRVCPLYRVICIPADWVAPFGNPRIKGYLLLPAAYRSLSRPSSPLRAKASPVRS